MAAQGVPSQIKSISAARKNQSPTLRGALLYWQYMPVWLLTAGILPPQPHINRLIRRILGDADQAFFGQFQNGDEIHHHIADVDVQLE